MSDCPTYTEGESFQTIFSGNISNVNYTISVNIFKDNPDIDFSRMLFSIQITPAGGSQINNAFVRPSADFLNNNLSETDTINYKIYKDVLRLQLDNPTYVLFSQVYGIIKIVNYNGEFIELLKKE